jgi:hypothetical protein
MIDAIAKPIITALTMLSAVRNMFHGDRSCGSAASPTGPRVADTAGTDALGDAAGSEDAAGTGAIAGGAAVAAGVLAGAATAGVVPAGALVFCASAAAGNSTAKATGSRSPRHL